MCMCVFVNVCVNMCVCMYFLVFFFFSWRTLTDTLISPYLLLKYLP